MDVDWAQIKAFANQRGVGLQCIDMGSYLWLICIESGLILNAKIKVEDPPSAELTDYLENYSASANKKISAEVVTQFEKDDKTLKVCKMKAAANEAGFALCELKVPGTPGEDVRYIAWGEAWFTSRTDGDCISSISIVDEDDVLGYGPGTVVQTYHDADVPVENQGLYVPQKGVGVEVEPLGGYGKIPSGLYLKITGQKGPGFPSNETLYVNIFWGNDN